MFKKLTLMLMATVLGIGVIADVASARKLTPQEVSRLRIVRMEAVGGNPFSARNAIRVYRKIKRASYIIRNGRRGFTVRLNNRLVRIRTSLKVTPRGLEYTSRSQSRAVNQPRYGRRTR